MPFMWQSLKLNRICQARNYQPLHINYCSYHAIQTAIVLYYTTSKIMHTVCCLTRFQFPSHHPYKVKFSIFFTILSHNEVMFLLIISQEKQFIVYSFDYIFLNFVLTTICYILGAFTTLGTTKSLCPFSCAHITI